MAAADVSINLAAEFVGKHAFKQADTAVDRLNKNVKSLARTFGYTFGAAAVVNFGKASVKAFAEDQKAALSLSKTIENLGLGYGGAALDVNNYISNLEKQTGILDDELRPAMDRLLRATSSITKSQELLSLALDISAGTGKDLTAVSQALQKAYLGQTQSLGRLGVGLSKAELTSSSFEEIQARLTTLFEGQAAQAADSYAGSIDKLSVAVNNAKELIGKDLITALNALGGEGGFPATLKLIESVSAGIGDLIIGVSRFVRDINIIAGKGSIIEKFRKLQSVSAADSLKDMKERAVYGGVYADQYKAQVAASAKVLSNNKKITKETAAQLAAKKLSQAIDKANLALGKGEDIFNLDKIQVAAALTNQAEQLGKATSAAQILAVTQDLQRLRVKQDIAALDDAIASKDEKAITAATAKLNEDLKILSVLSGQNVKLADIKTILDSLKPKDLINLDNLNAALAALKLIMADLGTAASLPIAKIPPKVTIPTNPVTPNPNVPNPLVPNPNVQNQPPTTPPTSSPNYSNPDFIPLIPQGGLLGVSNDSINELLDATAARADALASLLDDETAAIQSALNAIAVSGLSSVLNNDRAGGSGGLGFGSPIVNVYANTIANPDELTNLIQDSIIRINRRGDLLTTAGAL